MALLAAACQPGWVNPLAGSGDGTGTTPGATGVANTDVALTAPTSMVAIPGGGFYVYDADVCAIYKEAGNGTTSLYAGTPGSCGNSGDGGPATEALIQNFYVTSGMALGPDGTLYFAQSAKQQTYPGPIRAVSPDGMIDTFRSGLNTSVAVSPDGTVFVGTAVVDTGLTAGIDRREADGSWTTVHSVSGPGVILYAAASSTEVLFTYALANTATLQRLDVSTGTATSTDVIFGLPELNEPVALAAAADGTLYLGASSYMGNSIAVDGMTFTDEVVRIDPDGTVTPIAGTGSPDPATSRQWGDAHSLDLSANSLAVTPNNGLLISSGHTVYRLDHPALAGSTTTVPSTTLPAA